MAKGQKTGGRKPGSRNKAVIERERVAAEIAARTVADAKVSGRKLAKEQLDDFMTLFAGMAAHHQPIPGWKEGDPVPAGRNPDEAKFKEYAMLTIDCARILAPYQSPTYKTVFHADHQMPGAGLPGDNAKPVTAEIIDLKTDVRAAHHTYIRAIAYGKDK